MKSEIARIGVVIPAHNEEVLLPGCLRALQAAVKLVSVPVDILVVLDDCTDASRDVCRQLGVETRQISARNVGAARATGLRALLAHESDPEAVWLASTDADSCVGPTWLRDQLNMARSGADVVLGVVRLSADSAAPELRRAFDADYQKSFTDGASHNHVHGANLGLRASVYLRAGGFPDVHNHEDRRLIQLLRRTPGVIIERSQRLIVSTSGRLDGRCDHGFATTLAALDAAAST